MRTSGWRQWPAVVRFATRPAWLPLVQPLHSSGGARTAIRALFLVGWLACYLAGFGSHIAAALEYLRDPSSLEAPASVGELIGRTLKNLLQACAAVALACALVIASCGPLDRNQPWWGQVRLRLALIGLTPLGRQQPGRRHGFGLVMLGVAYAVITAGGSALQALLGLWLPSTSYPVAAGYPAAQALLAPVQSFEAGLGEEVLCVGLLVFAFERCRANVWLLYLVAVGVRLAFHLYYGWSVVAMVPWAAAAVWLFRRFRSVVPLIVAHALFDTAALWGMTLSDPAGEAVLEAAVLALGPIVVALLVVLHRGRRRRA